MWAFSSSLMYSEFFFLDHRKDQEGFESGEYIPKTVEYWSEEQFSIQTQVQITEWKVFVIWSKVTEFSEIRYFQIFRLKYSRYPQGNKIPVEGPELH